MYMARQTIWRGVLALAATLVVGSAMAQATFTLNLSSTDNNGDTSCAQREAGCTNGSVNGKFSAWASATTNTSSLLQAASITDQGSSGLASEVQMKTRDHRNTRLTTAARMNLS
jgi:hypothetical protein